MICDIIYRACGKEVYPDQKRPIRPHWFDKLKCFQSCYQMTIDDPATFRIHIIYSNERNIAGDIEYAPLLEYIRPLPMYHDGLKCVDTTGYDNIHSAYDYADTLNGDWIYFVEDDYIHCPDAARVFVEGASRFSLISLYDHRTDDITGGLESLALTPSCHWRTAESTCMTYGISREKWQHVREIARKHGAGDRSFFKELITGMGLRLWTPIPARSTHCYKGYMSPLVDWDKVAEGVKI